jgi:hypothetical protein
MLFAQPLTIVLAGNAPEPEVRAAKVLQHFLSKMTKSTIPVAQSDNVPDKSPRIFLGRHPQLQGLGLMVPNNLPDDSYYWGGQSANFVIAGGGTMGSEYGVYALLEKLGCRRYTPRDSFIPEVDEIRLPVLIPVLEKPAFPYRELWYEPAMDDGWARWHRLKRPSVKQAEWGMFVHTLGTLCPPDKYFKSHPEYFAWNGAQYVTGQPCLSNDTVRQIVIASLREKIKARPDAQYWSVSQNDNFDYCKCPRCAASDKRYGSPAGTLLTFVNAIGYAFQEKTISTLAYQYTRQAPKGIRPFENVSVCLCSIECNRGKSIADGCPDFARDVEEWSQLTERLMIWDYVVQFRSYECPFPNWSSLQPNLKLFQKNAVRMVFEQGSGRDRSEFSDMRAYLLAKLMWNPYASVDSILNDFGPGFYGIGYNEIKLYVNTEKSLLDKGDHNLQIYGTPQTYSHTFLRPSMLKLYSDLKRTAYKNVGPDTARQKRVIAAFLPVQYALLEMAKTEDGLWRQDTAGQWSPDWRLIPDPRVFTEACKSVGVTHLNESGETPIQYEKAITEYLKQGRLCHLASCRNYKSTVTLREKASPKYQNGDAQTLADSRTGDTDYHYNWLGFEGTDLQATIDLSAVKDIHVLDVRFLQDQQSWVFYPQKVILEISNNGVEYQKILEKDVKIEADAQKSILPVRAVLPTGTQARYVRLTGVNQKTCPGWHPGNGNAAWIFADEVIVR